MQNLRLLIVDDEVGMGLAIQRALREYTIVLSEMDGPVGFEITHTTTGEEALELLQSTPPDILLLDHKLPGISGLEILARLSAGRFDLLTVMVTAYASLENAVLATKRGAFDYLAKPFTPDELKSVVYKSAKHLLLQRQARRLADEKRLVRFEFISILAHELKAPLAAVEQYLCVLGDMLTAEAEKQILTRSTARIQGMRKLILDLLDLTRIESGQRRRELQMIDIGRILADSIELMMPSAAARSIIIETAGPEPAALMADRWEIQTMISNLLSNAIKYNTENGRVTIRITALKNGLSIAFEDTGIGISPGAARNLFSEFARIRNEATEFIPGSGLGLSIVKKIAALYHGDVVLASEEGRGSTFTLILHSADSPN